VRQLVHADDLPISRREEPNHLYLDRVAIRLLGVYHVDIGNGRAINEDLFDRRSTATQRLLQCARMIDEAVIVQLFAVDDLDVVRRENSA
jgi:hypothetical protein